MIHYFIKDTIIDSTIMEYNISKSIPSIMCKLYPNNQQFKDRLDMNKETYSALFEKDFTNNVKYINEYYDNLKITHYEFMRKNNIPKENVIGFYYDSIIIQNSIPKELTIDGIRYKSKTSDKYTSLFWISDELVFLYDAISNHVKYLKFMNPLETKYQGLDGSFQDKVNRLPFVSKILKNMFRIINDKNRLKYDELVLRLQQIRINYVSSNDKEIYRSLLDNGMFKYLIDGSIQSSNIYLKEDDNCVLDKNDNYINIVLPLIQSCL